MGAVDHSGRILEKKYRLVRRLGQGGMGAVYLGEHLVIGKKVGVKFLHAEFASDREIVTRFYREAQAAAAIGHKSIIDIMDVGVSSEGEPYLVMEFLEGESLASMLKRERTVGLGAACGIMEPVLLGLNAAHAKGIVHRDLKPENIFLAHQPGEAPAVKIIDFGISKITRSKDSTRLTQSGSLLGTPAYMSPEQAMGSPDANHRSDIYSMGVVLYEMLTGRLPFDGQNYNALLINIITHEPLPMVKANPGFPRDSERVVLKAMAKDPADRYQNALEMLDAMRGVSGFAVRQEQLSHFASRMKKSFAMGDLGVNEKTDPAGGIALDVLGEVTSGATPSLWSRTSIKKKRNFGKIVGISAIAAVVLAAGLFFALKTGTTEEQAQAAKAAAAEAAVAPNVQKTQSEAPTTIYLTVLGAPRGAKISFDGAPIQENPFKVLQRDASFVLSVEAEGFEPFKTLVSTKRDKIVDVVLKPVADVPKENVKGGVPSRTVREAHSTKEGSDKEKSDAPAEKIRKDGKSVDMAASFE
jgi:serine/threonine protein kinase